MLIVWLVVGGTGGVVSIFGVGVCDSCLVSLIEGFRCFVSSGVDFWVKGS